MLSKPRQHRFFIPIYYEQKGWRERDAVKGGERSITSEIFFFLLMIGGRQRLETQRQDCLCPVLLVLRIMSPAPDGGFLTVAHVTYHTIPCCPRCWDLTKPNLPFCFRAWVFLLRFGIVSHLSSLHCLTVCLLTPDFTHALFCVLAVPTDICCFYAVHDSSRNRHCDITC